MGLFGSKYSKFVEDLPDVSGKVFVITGKPSKSQYCVYRDEDRNNQEHVMMKRF